MKENLGRIFVQEQPEENPRPDRVLHNIPNNLLAKRDTSFCEQVIGLETFLIA